MKNKAVLTVIALAIIAAVIIVPLALSPSGGGSALEEYDSYVYAMDTVMSLRAYSADAETANAALADAAGAINDLESRISVTDENSEIYLINSTSDTPTAVSADTAEIISRALDVCAGTNGNLDISIYPVLRAWGFTDSEGGYRVPSYNEIQQLLRRVDYRDVQVDGSTVTLAPGMQIDLGSVAKGYTGDLVAGILEDAGITSAILDLGGNVRAVGASPDGEPWRIGVQDPNDTENYFGVISVTDKSVVTSGGYNRYFVEDGKTYWHILDPYTGYPADSGVISTTIVGDDGLVCDGLSTATFVMGVNESFDFWRKSGGDFDMLLLTENGHIYITPGLEDCFELSIGYEGVYTVEVVH